MPRTRSIERKFARIYKEDERDSLYRMKAKLPTYSARTSRFWNDTRWFGDQKDTPHCVGYAAAHWLEDGPVRPVDTKPLHKGASRKPPYIKPSLIYVESQKRDEIPGEDYEGTTVRGAFKYFKAIEMVESYWWADDIDDLIMCLLERGPVVVGTDWRSGMMEPDREGFIRAQGDSLGGHAYVLNGVNTKQGFFRVKNSWGRDWGHGGRAKITFGNMELLIHAGEWEAALAVELPGPMTKPSKAIGVESTSI